MGEQRQAGMPRSRWVKIAAIAVMCLVCGGAVSFAAVEAWNYYSGSVQVLDDGTVVDENGAVVGLSLENEDGTTTTTLEVEGGYIQMDTEESLKGQAFQFQWEPAKEK